MKNNKGFSILELIVSFSLTMIIVIVLFEIIVYMKELYEKSVTQTELVNRQNIITDYIYTDLLSKNLYNISACGNNCIEFYYSEGESKQLKWDPNLNTLGYGSYTMSLIKNTNFDQTLSLSDYNNNVLTGTKICGYVGYSSDPNSYISIKIPISNVLFEDRDFGLNIFYAYPTNTVSVNLPFSTNC